MSPDAAPGPGLRTSGGAARAVGMILGLLVLGAAAGFVGRLLWPRKRHV
jgi:hypothetical protein